MFQFVADEKNYQEFRAHQRGMTLIEVLITVGIAAIVMTSMMSDIFKTQRTVQTKDANRDIVQAIRELLTDPLICKASFGGGNPNGAGFSKTQIVDSAVPANIKYQTGVLQLLLNLRLQVESNLVLQLRARLVRRKELLLTMPVRICQFIVVIVEYGL